MGILTEAILAAWGEKRREDIRATAGKQRETRVELTSSIFTNAAKYSALQYLERYIAPTLEEKKRRGQRVLVRDQETRRAIDSRSIHSESRALAEVVAFRLETAEEPSKKPGKERNV